MPQAWTYTGPAAPLPGLLMVLAAVASATGAPLAAQAGTLPADSIPLATDWLPASWLSFGLGGAQQWTPHEAEFAAVGTVSLSFPRRPMVYSVRFLGASQMQMCLGTCPTRPNSTTELAVVAGPATFWGWGGASVGLGPGVVLGRFASPSAEQESFIALGLSLEARLFSMRRTGGGVGLNGFLNFNREHMVAGAAIEGRLALSQRPDTP